MGEPEYKKLEDVFSRAKKEGWDRVICKEMPGEYDRNIVGAVLAYGEHGLALEIWFQDVPQGPVDIVRVPMYTEGGIQIKIDVSEGEK